MRARLLLSGLDMTLFVALHTCDVFHHVIWIGPFWKWLSIKRQKEFLENLFFHNISLIYALKILQPEGNVSGQKKTVKIWRQLPVEWKDLNFGPLLCVNLWTLNSGDHLISPGIITPESNAKVIIIKERFTKSTRSWLLDEFSFQVPQEIYREQYAEVAYLC